MLYVIGQGKVSLERVGTEPGGTDGTSGDSAGQLRDGESPPHQTRQQTKAGCYRFSLNRRILFIDDK